MWDFTRKNPLGGHSQYILEAPGISYYVYSFSSHLSLILPPSFTLLLAEYFMYNGLYVIPVSTAMILTNNGAGCFIFCIYVRRIARRAIWLAMLS